VDRESALNLEQDAPAVASFLEENEGALTKDDADDGVYWAAMRPRSTPAERYFARIGWAVYPHGPPSIKFADRVGGSLTAVSAWPVITGYRASAFDICRPISAEGYAVHPEWGQGSTAWVADGNPFLWVVQTMQFHLDNEYQGRAA
jgi:hypothetical protein